VTVGMQRFARAGKPVLGLLVPLSLSALGCPSRPTGPAGNGRPRAVRVVPKAEVVVAVEGFLSPAKRVGRVERLPPYPRFRDPFRLPRRSLKRERRMAFKSHGRKRQRIITHLAARLWGMANQYIDKIQALEKAARAEGRPPPRDQIDPMRRMVSSHLQECVTLLEGVLESRRAPAMARVRLAHYLRKLKPAASVKLFQQLLGETSDPSTRSAYALDLAQLLVTVGRAAEARKVLRDVRGAGAARALLLRALALAHGGGRAAALRKSLARVIRAIGSATPAVRRSVIWHLPQLLTRLERPVRLIDALASAAPALYKRHGGATMARLLARLLARGRLRTARRVLSTAIGSGIAIPQAVRARVARTAGPWQSAAKPPPAVAWTSQVRARLPTLASCFASRQLPVRAWSLELKVLPDGSVSNVTQRAGIAGRRPDGKGGSAAKAGKERAALGRCLQRRARQWSFPPWEAALSVRLVVSLKATVP